MTSALKLIQEEISDQYLLSYIIKQININIYIYDKYVCEN